MATRRPWLSNDPGAPGSDQWPDCAIENQDREKERATLPELHEILTDWQSSGAKAGLLLQLAAADPTEPMMFAGAGSRPCLER